MSANDSADTVAADQQLTTDIQQLRDQVAGLPADRPVSADERTRLDEAILAMQRRTAEALAGEVGGPDPGRPVKLGDKAGTPGGVVDLISVDHLSPAAMTGPQGGVVNLDDRRPAPTEGVPGEAQFVDLGASQPTEVAPNPPAGEAAKTAAEDDEDADGKDRGGRKVTEPAPDAPLSEAPTDDEPLSENPDDEPSTKTTKASKTTPARRKA